VLIILSCKFSYAQENSNQNNYKDSLINNMSYQHDTVKVAWFLDVCLIHFDESNYASALNSAFAGLNQAQKLTDTLWIAQYELVIGAIYERNGDFERAEGFCIESLNHFISLDNRSGKQTALLNLAIIAAEKGNIDLSDSYSQMALKLAKKHTDTLAIMQIYSNMAYYAFQDEKYNKSLFLVDSGLVFSNEQMSQSDDDYLHKVLSLQVNLAENLTILKHNDKALVVLQKIEKDQEILSLRELADMYRMLTTVYVRLGDSFKAIKYLQLERRHEDSLNLIKHNQILTEIKISQEVKYIEQDKQLAIDKAQLFQNKNEIVSLKLKEQKSNLLFLQLSIFVVLVILSIFILFYFSVRAKNKRLVEKNIEMTATNDGILYELKFLSDTKDKDEFQKKEKKNISDELKKELVDKLNVAFNEDEIYRDQSLSLQLLSQKLDTNRVYLSQVIKELHPEGFLSFVNEYRIRKSWRMLSDTDNFNLTIKYISKEVGFKSQPTFNKAFKKFTGVTPSFYLNEVKKN